jgi:diadenylate cyclase
MMDPISLKSLWRPVLEIVLLTVGIYYALMFVRGTRGWPVVVGFLVILAMTLVTGALKLDVLSWLLRTFFAFSALAILIIFQPELRRLLAELGSLPLFSAARETVENVEPIMRHTAREQRENIEIIIQTVERLADVRIGALIAIEQATPLWDVVGSGIVVNCEATPEMLETIFFPNNAIHDGGVIIKGDRITHAACIFPLTQRQDLNKSLGTRHRAAIGLTEETDAVVVAVSEETASISYAFKGQLVRGVTLEELRAFLTSVLIKRPKARTFVEWIRGWMGGRSRRVAPSNGKAGAK